MLTRDELVKPLTKEITIGDGPVVIRALTADEAISLADMDLKGKEIFGLLATSLYDPKMTAEDISMLPSVYLKKLVDDVFVFNGMTKKAVADAVDELKKTQVSEEAIS